MVPRPWSSRLYRQCMFCISRRLSTTALGDSCGERELEPKPRLRAVHFSAKNPYNDNSSWVTMPSPIDG